MFLGEELLYNELKSENLENAKIYIPKLCILTSLNNPVSPNVCGVKEQATFYIQYLNVDVSIGRYVTAFCHETPLLKWLKRPLAANFYCNPQRFV